MVARALSRVIVRTRLCASPGSLYGVLRRCEGAGGMWAHSRCESAREARLDPVSGAVRGGLRSRVAFVGGALTLGSSICGACHLRLVE